MTYEYDAFFSYKRDQESNDWHDRVREKVTFWLKHELEREDIKIFIDREDIRTGARWSEKLTSALKRSKCIVCIWSPRYFQSKWCLSEWLTFVERGTRYERNLILPASYFDGESFPPEARQTQWADFSNFASTMPKFWETSSAVKFEDTLLKPFASDLATMIRQAPPYDESFPIVEALDTQIQLPRPIGRIADV